MMALPSQSARPIARRSYMHRTSRGRPGSRRLIFGGVGAVVLVAAGWVLWPGGDDAPDSARGGAADGARPEIDRGTPTPGPAGAEPVGTGLMAASITGEDDDPEAARPAPAERNQTTPARREIERPPARPPATPPTARDTTPASTAAAPASAPAPEARPSRDTAGPGTAGARSSGRRALQLVEAGADRLARNQPVEGRRLLSQALASGTLSDADARAVRRRLTELNERLVFSPEVADGDPFAMTYMVRDNDRLSRIPRRMGIQVEWQFIQHVNRIADPRRLRAGQRLKLVTGPFHAVIHKHAYRMDVYLGDGAERVFVRSFDVGLGEYDSTPEGRFRVRENSKLVNPEWRNPRTRELYLPDDPANPIGEHWIGLVADDEHLTGVTGYGIHGTIEPDSIGRQASMGCIRMRPDDVALIWGMLVAQVSEVEISN
jgi:hypothetical protein